MRVPLLLCLFVLSVATGFLAAEQGFPPRPAFPQFMFIDHGVVECAYGGGAPPCASATRGVMMGWYAFDHAGNFSNYREDSVLTNSSIVFNRELATPEGTREFFLLSDKSATLQCFQFSAPASFSRFSLADARYEGIDSVKGFKVYSFKAKWLLLGQEALVTVWVSVETEKIFGWSWGPVAYYYYSYTDLPSFDSWPFVPPEGVTCQHTN